MNVAAIALRAKLASVARSWAKRNRSDTAFDAIARADEIGDVGSRIGRVGGCRVRSNAIETNVVPANLGDESWAVPEARRTPCSRGRDVRPENPKARFPLPIHAYMDLEEPDGGSLTKSDFSIDAGRLELEYLSNMNSLNHRLSVAPMMDRSEN